MFGHSIARNLMTNFEEITNKLAQQKVYQIYMDRPKVNLKFYSEADDKRTQSFFHSLIDRGTFSVYSERCTVKSGVESTSRSIKDILKGRFNLLHDSPARREDFRVVKKPDMYPFYFSTTRRAQNMCVVDRMVEIALNIKKIMEFWNMLQT